MGGELHLEADFVDGTIAGWIKGSGEGSHVVPGGWGGMDEPETWYAEIGVIDGTFNGPLDRVTGAFDIEFDFYAEAWGYREAPGITYRCNTDDWTLTCALPEIWPDQSGTLAGTIGPEGRIEGAIDLYTFDGVYCATTYEGRTRGVDGCPTVGRWAADVTNVVWRENQAPEVGGIASSPADPTTDDAIVFTVEATDPDEDTLTYAWYIDGTREGPSAPSVTWAKPTAGDHVIKVTVSDGGESVDAFLDLRVSEHVGDGDKDDDGVPDDEDLCPDEWGENEDGCPPFAASVACAPAKPLPKDSVVCTATVAGLHVGEEPLFDWYLDGGSQQSGEAATWTWPSAESGTHDIGVQAVGDRSLLRRRSQHCCRWRPGGRGDGRIPLRVLVVQLGRFERRHAELCCPVRTGPEDVGPLAVTLADRRCAAASEVASGSTCGVEPRRSRRRGITT